MPKVKYNAKLLPDKHLSCPHEVIERLKLQVGSQVKVVIDKKTDMPSKSLPENTVSLRNSIPELSAITDAEIKNAKNLWDNKLNKIANEL